MDDENIVKDQSVLSSSSDTAGEETINTISMNEDTNSMSTDETTDLQKLLEEINKHDIVIETAVVHMDNMVSNIQTLNICSAVLLAVLIGCTLSSILSRFFRG